MPPTTAPHQKPAWIPNNSANTRWTTKANHDTMCQHMLNHQQTTTAPYDISQQRAKPKLNHIHTNHNHLHQISTALNRKKHCTKTNLNNVTSILNQLNQNWTTTEPLCIVSIWTNYILSSSINHLTTIWNCCCTNTFTTEPHLNPLCNIANHAATSLTQA